MSAAPQIAFPGTATDRFILFRPPYFKARLPRSRSLVIHHFFWSGFQGVGNGFHWFTLIEDSTSRTYSFAHRRSRRVRPGPECNQILHSSIRTPPPQVSIVSLVAYTYIHETYAVPWLSLEAARLPISRAHCRSDFSGPFKSSVSSSRGNDCSPFHAREYRVFLIILSLFAESPVLNVPCIFLLVVITLFPLSYLASAPLNAGILSFAHLSLLVSIHHPQAEMGLPCR